MHNDDKVLTEFWRKITEELLPVYCNDAKRGYSIAGFKPTAKIISAQDARDFMRALDCKAVTDLGGCRYLTPIRGEMPQVLFWEGQKKIKPRPITLWVETLVTIAAMGRLHLDYGWPIECLQMQSVNWEFDMVVFKQQEFKNEYIAGEVKSDKKKLDLLLENLHKCCRGDHDCNNSASSASRERYNAHQKWLGLCRSHASFFWALGPGGDSRVFKVYYSPDGIITLEKTSETQLNFS